MRDQPPAGSASRAAQPSLAELSKPSAPRRSNMTPVTGPVRVAGLDFVLRSESLLSGTRKGRTANTPSPPTDAPPRHSLYQFSPKTTQEHYPTGKTGNLSVHLDSLSTTKTLHHPKRTKPNPPPATTHPPNLVPPPSPNSPTYVKVGATAPMVRRPTDWLPVANSDSATS